MTAQYRTEYFLGGGLAAAAGDGYADRRAVAGAVDAGAVDGGAVPARQVVERGQRVVDRDQRAAAARLDVTVPAHQRRRSAPPERVVHEVVAVGVLPGQSDEQRPGARRAGVVGDRAHARVGAAAHPGAEHAGDLVHGVVHGAASCGPAPPAAAGGSTMIRRSASIGAKPRSRSANSAIRCGER